jgi:hypothetical protein
MHTKFLDKFNFDLFTAIITNTICIYLFIQSFMVDLTMLLITRTTYFQMVKLLINNKLEGTWKEAVMV